MTHENDHGSPFTAEEAASLHEQDRKAAKAVVLLMLGIFVMGLLGYAAVAVWVG
jgi:hypothetical protein